MIQHPDSVAEPGDGLEPLREVTLHKGDESVGGNYRWFCGVGRELFAEEHDGRWRHIEYAFPDATGLLVLHWTDGKSSRLWRVAGSAASDEEELQRLSFPATEMQVLEQVMHTLPHSLWARLIKLALDAHFFEEAYPARRHKLRVERRQLPRSWR